MIHQGFTTHDSLDPKKIEGLLQLHLDEKGIENLDGLQHFKKVSWLSIYRNKIRILSHLPPNLKVLSCFDNEITRLDTLPNSLEHLSCFNNRINSIDKLPPTLLSINFANNLMRYIPKLPPSIQELNFAFNPIEFEKLPASYRKLPCDHPRMNCLPNDQIDWNILGVNTNSTAFTIKRLRLIIRTDNVIDTIEYNVHDNNFQRTEEPIGESQNSYSFEYGAFKQIIYDLIDEKIDVAISCDTSEYVISLSRIRNGRTPPNHSCEHCRFYHFNYEIDTDKGKMNLTYSFEGRLSEVDLVDTRKAYLDLHEVLDFLYFYKLLNLTLPSHQTLKDPAIIKDIELLRWFVEENSIN